MRPIGGVRTQSVRLLYVLENVTAIAKLLKSAHAQHAQQHSPTRAHFFDCSLPGLFVAVELVAGLVVDENV